MSQSLFDSPDGLDTAYLEQAYAGDAATAAFVCEHHLQYLPANLQLIEQSVAQRDIRGFLHHVHNQKPSFIYVGLTYVTDKRHQLHVNCHAEEDLTTFKGDID